MTIHPGGMTATRESGRDESAERFAYGGAMIDKRERSNADPGSPQGATVKEAVAGADPLPATSMATIVAR
jgi:hypothetical protein